MGTVHPPEVLVQLLHSRHISRGCVSHETAHVTTTGEAKWPRRLCPLDSESWPTQRMRSPPRPSTGIPAIAWVPLEMPPPSFALVAHHKLLIVATRPQQKMPACRHLCPAVDNHLRFRAGGRGQIQSCGGDRVSDTQRSCHCSRKSEARPLVQARKARDGILMPWILPAREVQHMELRWERQREIAAQTLTCPSAARGAKGTRAHRGRSMHCHARLQP